MVGLVPVFLEAEGFSRFGHRDRATVRQHQNPHPAPVIDRRNLVAAAEEPADRTEENRLLRQDPGGVGAEPDGERRPFGAPKCSGSIDDHQPLPAGDADAVGSWEIGVDADLAAPFLRHARSGADRFRAGAATAPWLRPPGDDHLRDRRRLADTLGAPACRVGEFPCGRIRPVGRPRTAAKQATRQHGHRQNGCDCSVHRGILAAVLATAEAALCSERRPGEEAAERDQPEGRGSRRADVTP